MKKTLLAAALAVGFAGVAQAETSVTLYGVIDTGLSYERSKERGIWVDGDGAGNIVGSSYFSAKKRRTGIHDGTQMGQAGSRWGLRGVEDLGNGLRGEFMLESGFNVTNGDHQQGGRLFGRQAWLGLASDSWGYLRFGRQHNVGTDFMLGMIDPFSGGFGLANGGATFSAINTNRMDNTVKYVTPDFSGFQFGLAYSFNHDGAQEFKYSGEKDPNTRAFSTAVKYANGPLGLALTYDSITNSGSTYVNPKNGKTAKNKTASQWNLGGSYDFEVVKVSAAFGQSRNGIVNSSASGYTVYYDDDTIAAQLPKTVAGVNRLDKGFKANGYLLGLSAPIGGGTLMASWHMSDPRKAPNRWNGQRDMDGKKLKLKKIQTYAIGYKYPLSKRTDVYAYGAYKKNADYINRNKKTAIAAGITHRF